jgi:hypothetical protein
MLKPTLRLANSLSRDSLFPRWHRLLSASSGTPQVASEFRPPVTAGNDNTIREKLILSLSEGTDLRAISVCGKRSHVHGWVHHNRGFSCLLRMNDQRQSQSQVKAFTVRPSSLIIHHSSLIIPLSVQTF